MTTATASNKTEPAASTVLSDMGLGNNLPPTVEKSEDVAPTPAPVVDKAADPADPVPDKTADPEPVPAAETTREPKDNVTKILERTSKQLKDLRDTWTQERQLTKEQRGVIASLNQKIDVLTKKVDGTYDEATDAPKPRSSEEVAAQAKQSGRVEASHFAAIDYLMATDALPREQAEAKVKELVWNDDAPFRAFDQDQNVQMRVMNAPAPIIEAIKVVREAEAKKKYGSDPEQMRAAIVKEVTEHFEKDILPKRLKELQKKGGYAEEVIGLGGQPNLATSNSTAPPSDANKFESLFPGFIKSAG